MRSISEKSLQAGSKLAAALLDEKGRVLVPAGTMLTDDVLSRVRRLARRMSLFIDDEVPENAADASDNEIQSSANVAQAPAAQDQPTANHADDPPSNQIGVDSLKVGERTPQNLYDASGVLLLAAGSAITPRFLFLLRQRRIRILHTTTPTAPVERGERADEQPSGNCGQLDVGAMVAEIRRGLELHSRATVEVEQSFRALDACRADATNVLREIVDRFRQSMSLHRSLLAVLATLKQHFDEYLYDHCVNSALMTLTIGEQLGYQESMLRHVALAAICHDVGMLSVPDEIRLAPRRLTPDEQFEVHRHVQCAEQKLRGLTGLPEIVPTIVAQVHERGDGSGYPAGRRLTSIHPFARVVAVADVYAAMTHKRPHREPMIPYQAMREILTATGAGRFDAQVVRALLDRVSAFPVGSGVELNDGRVCRVLRAGIGAHTRPIVAPVDAAGRAMGQAIDLFTQPQLSVRRAVSLPADTAVC